MIRRRLRFGLVVLATTAVVIVVPHAASAQGRPGLSGGEFGYGDEIDRVGAIADARLLATMKESLPGRPAVGFKYTVLSVVVPVWTSDGQFCIYARDRYIPVPKAMAATLLGVSEAELREPFFYRYPFGLVAVPAVALVGGPVTYFLNRRRRRLQERAEALSASLIGADLPPSKPSRSFLSD